MPDSLDSDPTTPYPRLRRLGTARGAIGAVFLAALLLVVFAGDSIERTGREMPAGVPRDVVIAVGKPTGAIARALPFASAADAVEGWFGADESDDASSAASTPAAAPVVLSGSDRTITADRFDRRTVQEAGAATPLRSLLVTGDSMSQPLDAILARQLAARGVKVTRDARLGSGISKPFVVDWVPLAAEQAAEVRPQVVVVMLGANEGFPLEVSGKQTECCSAAWAAAYATRVRAMAGGWLGGGAEHLIWLSLPAPRDAKRQPIARAVNEAVRQALAGFGARATVLSTDVFFTPGGAWREVMSVDGREQIVRRSDGIHLNDTGSRLAADLVQAELARAYALRD